MPKCTFCGHQIEEGTGKMFIYNSGKIDHFCSQKCEKNLLKLGRKARKLKWTRHFVKAGKTEEKSS